MAWSRKRRRRDHAVSSAFAIRRGQAVAYWITVNYREAYGCTPATEFCSTTNPPCAAKPLSRARSRVHWPAIHLGLQDCLYLGNLDAQRDWGHARDYVEMQWLMLQQTGRKTT